MSWRITFLFYDKLAGFIKFSIELANWKWCGNTPSDDSCGKKNKQETGQFVDLTISVKGDSVAQEEPTDDNNGFAYSLGGETDIQFSQMVSYMICYYYIMLRNFSVNNCNYMHLFRCIGVHKCNILLYCII